MESMTGYGKGVFEGGGVMVKAEIRGVNQKNLDIQVKIPPALLFTETKVRETAREFVKRGRVEIFLSYQILSPELVSVAFSDSALRALHLRLKPLMDEGIVSQGISSSDILKLTELFSMSVSEEAAPLLEKAVVGACRLALQGFRKQRLDEGSRLREQFMAGSGELSAVVSGLGPLEEKQKEAVVSGFKARLAEMTSSLDPQRMEQEALLLAEKVDIREELVRLRSHLSALGALLGEEGQEQGRKLDFLLQELQRETSTMLAKASLMEITQAGLEMRRILEQLREQVSNVA